MSGFAKLRRCALQYNRLNVTCMQSDLNQLQILHSSRDSTIIVPYDIGIVINPSTSTVYPHLLGMAITMSKPQSKAESLAAIIGQNTVEISQYLASQGLPDLSFSPEAPLALVLPSRLQRAQAELFDATAELHDLATGPISYLVGLTSPTVSCMPKLQLHIHPTYTITTSTIYMRAFTSSMSIRSQS